MESTQRAIQEIIEETKASEDLMKVTHLDLSSLNSVKKCALAVKTLLPKYVLVIFSNTVEFL